MARKRPQHAKDFSEPMRWQDMTGQQQKAAKGIVSDFTGNFGPTAEKQATALEKQASQPGVKPSNAKLYGGKAKRLRKAADIAPSGPVSLNDAANNRISAMEKAATTMRLPEESAIGGAGWYFHAHGDVRAHAPNTHPDVAMTASSMMSPGTDPQTERRALQSLDTAHAHGSVHFGPELVQHLSAKGVAVPAELHDRAVPFAHIPGHVVGQMAQLDTQDAAHAHSHNVDYRAMGAISSTTNVAKAHDLMRGSTPLASAQSPTDAPKTWSYTDAQKKSVPGSDEHSEYMARAQHLGDTMRGTQHGGQQMLDLWGKRDSNEGILSNKQHTAEDNWMRGVSVGLKDPGLLKAGGDVQPGIKVHPEHGPAAPPGVGGEAVYHAWNQRATQMAAEKLQKQHGLEFTVPSVLVQETAWTGARREAGQSGGRGDQEFNAHVRGVRQAEVDAHKENSGKSLGPQFEGLKAKQERLF